MLDTPIRGLISSQQPEQGKELEQMHRRYQGWQGEEKCAADEPRISLLLSLNDYLKLLIFPLHPTTAALYAYLHRNRLRAYSLTILVAGNSIHGGRNHAAIERIDEDEPA